MSLVNRGGLGKAKHVDMQSLWIQEAFKSDRFASKKIGTNVNPADLMTKPLTKQKNEELMSIMGYKFLENDKSQGRNRRRERDDVFTAWDAGNFLQSDDFRSDPVQESVAIRRCMTRRLGMRRTRSSDVCQMTKPTQVSLRIEVFNESRARARGRVLTDST